jgi:hypothetical protein
VVNEEIHGPPVSRPTTDEAPRVLGAADYVSQAR